MNGQRDKTEKICCITGRRPNHFPFPYGKTPETATYKKRLEQALVHLIEEEGVTRFITGGALGIDLDVAEIILQLQKKHPTVSHLLVIPYQNQGGRYALNDKIRYNDIAKKSSSIVLAEHYTRWCMQQRNEYMVDEAQIVAAFVSGEKTGGTYNTIRYAQRKQKRIYTFDLSTCLQSDPRQWIRSASPPTQINIDEL